MKRIIAIGVAAICAALVAPAMVPLSLSSEALRDEVVARIAALSGYEVEVRGSTELRLFPSLRFSVSDVQLRSPHADGELAHIDAVTGSVALLPLLIGRIDIDGVSLIRPRVALEVDADGHKNWLSGQSGLVWQSVASPEAQPPGEVQIGGLRIEDGRLHYIDHRDGKGYQVRAVTANMAWPTLAAPLSGNGSLEWDDEHVAFDFHADKPFSFIRRGSSAARISVTSAFADISFSGDAHLTDDAHIRGRLALSTNAGRHFLSRLGTNLGPGIGLDTLDLSGRVSLLGNTAVISGLRMVLDGNEAEGSLKVDFEDERIGVQGTLAFDTLDLGRYRATPSKGESRTTGDGSISSAPIDLSDLHKAEADIRISAERVALGNVKVGDTAGTVTIREGVLTIGLAQAELRGGSLRGTVILAPQPDGVQTRANAALERVSLAQLSADLGLAERLEGTLDGWATLIGRGLTLEEIVASLSGEARFVATNGSLRGIGLSGIIDELGYANLVGFTRSNATAKFHRLDATLQIEDGVVMTRDLRLTGPDLYVALEADLQLASTSIDGRGTAALPVVRGEDPGFPLPFLIEGPLAEPRLSLDPAWLRARARDRLRSGAAAEDLIDTVLRQRLDALR